ncbi:MAG: hypothetical protein ABSE22_02645 [Xanthobacteraceae bacterium]
MTQPVSEQALQRLRAAARVTVFADASRIIPKRTLIEAVRKADILYCLLHDKIDRSVVTANPNLRLIAAQSITPSNIDVDAATERRIPVTVTAAITTEASARRWRAAPTAFPCAFCIGRRGASRSWKSAKGA